jgi:hypothetical protein
MSAGGIVAFIELELALDNAKVLFGIICVGAAMFVVVSHDWRKV